MSRKTFKLVTTTPELLSKVNIKNQQLVKQFLKEKDTRASDTTIKAYKSDLDIFMVWNLQFNEDKFFIDIKKLEFSDFFHYCTTELQWGSGRFNRMRSCLSSFSQFIEKFFDDDYPNFRNVLLKAVSTMPKVERRDKTILTEEQVKSLFYYLDNELGHLQEVTILALAIASGARVSELFRFKTTMIDENNTAFNGVFMETKEKIKTKGRTKQGDLKFKYIIKDLYLPYHKRWLIERDLIMKANNQNHDFIFIKSDGSPAEVATFNSWIRKWETFLGVPTYAHMFRHYITSYLTRLGLPENLIVEIMGWKTGAMYKIYNDNEAKDMDWKELENLQKALQK